VARRKVKYLEKFSKKVKALFPDSKKINKALNIGSQSLKYYLWDEYCKGLRMTPRQIVKAFKEGDAYLVEQEAKRLIAVKKLSDECGRIHYKQGFHPFLFG